jgi:PAS domain S-box-containing protein
MARQNAKQVMKAPLPENEAGRLEALRRYAILDTPPDGAFDHITAVAADLFKVPIAIVSLVDHDRIWFKSKFGLDARQIDREPGLCASAILSPDVYHVRDAVSDPRTLANPLVAGEFGLRFYAAAPLRTHEGFNLGTVCILDKKPRDLSPSESELLKKLATLVMDQMELRLAARKIAELEAAERMAVETLRQSNEALAASEQRLRRNEALLRRLSAGTEAAPADQFFRALTQNLAAALGVRYAFVAELTQPERRVRTLAFWNGAGFSDNFEYDLTGTPCQRVLRGEVCHYQQDVQSLFPQDQDLVTLAAQSYLAVPLTSPNGCVLGHLAIIDVKPMPLSADDLAIFRIFGSRAGAELERQRAEAALKLSEENLRDLFDEAPIAYVNEGLDSKFIRANRAALKTLGITPEDVPHTYGKSFIPDTPDAQRRLKEAFDSIGRGTDTSGVVLELRRKDNGKPLWIQWWSRPSPDGTYTRTMFLDITERVLMEREKARLEAQNTYLQEEIRSEHNFGEIVGGSPALLDVLRAVEQVAPSDSTALIFGETGTGKELIARAIHDRSGRKARPLVKVNCGAISAGLVESELFGHVKGAFTGALTNRDGRFKVADGGTIFLDEVGELPLETQVKLLRVLQEQEFEPIGSSKTVKVDVRIIAATNRDLGAAVAEGKFRRDLYYRLNVFPITVPPLRERAADVPLLVSFFLQRFAKKFGKPVKRVSEETMLRLAAYAWPGNIRELQNVIERAILLSPGDTLMLAPDFGPHQSRVGVPPAQDEPHAGSPPAASMKEGAGETPALRSAAGSLEDVERRHIEAVLAQTNWMIEGERGAARILNLNPSTLRSRMKNLGIKRPAS